MTLSITAETGPSGLMSRYSTHDVAVRGGIMRVGEWRAARAATAAPVILALHCLAGAHLSWSFLAEQLPNVRIIAPDLRGRGRSSALPAPFGIEQHVDDILRVMDALHLPSVVVVGHSLGAFVAVAALEAHPLRISRAVLVDGGLPLTVPLMPNTDDLLETILGRRAVGHDLVFANSATHRRFWQLHPAFARDWCDQLGDYVDYLADETLDAEACIEYRAGASAAALEADASELCGSAAVLRRLEGVGDAAVLLTAGRGMFNETPGIYSASELELSRSAWSEMRHTQVAGVNHYTIVASKRGAAAVAREVRRALK